MEKHRAVVNSCAAARHHHRQPMHGVRVKTFHMNFHRIRNDFLIVFPVDWIPCNGKYANRETTGKCHVHTLGITNICSDLHFPGALQLQESGGLEKIETFSKEICRTSCTSSAIRFFHVCVFFLNGFCERYVVVFFLFFGKANRKLKEILMYLFSTQTKTSKRLGNENNICRTLIISQTLRTVQGSQKLFHQLNFSLLKIIHKSSICLGKCIERR